VPHISDLCATMYIGTAVAYMKKVKMLINNNSVFLLNAMLSALCAMPSRRINV
jgi:hypothetical protein